jgi:hypothetical protein
VAWLFGGANRDQPHVIRFSILYLHMVAWERITQTPTTTALFGPWVCSSGIRNTIALRLQLSLLHFFYMQFMYFRTFYVWVFMARRQSGACFISLSQCQFKVDCALKLSHQSIMLDVFSVKSTVALLYFSY